MIRSHFFVKMIATVTVLLLSMNLIFDQATSEPLSSIQNTNNENSNDTYFFNTPFANNSDMESFIRNKWQNYSSFNISPMVTPLKEILYTSFNPDQMKLRICDDVSLSHYKKLCTSRQPDHITVIMPSFEIPLRYFKWSLELMSILNDYDDEKLGDKMIAAVKNLNQLEKDGSSEISKLVKKCQAIVVVPRLFKGNFCEISPIIETYFPPLANVSLIELGGTFLPYNSVKNVTLENFHKSSNITWNDLENIEIPKAEDYISFGNLKIVVDHFQRNLTLLYLKHNQDGDGYSTAKNSVPLSNWANIYDTLHINVSRYLRIINQNGSKEYNELPWIGFNENTTNVQDDTVSLHLTRDLLSGDIFQHSSDHFGGMFHHHEKNGSTVGEVNDIEDYDGRNSKSEDLDFPIVSLAPSSIYRKRTSNTAEYSGLNLEYQHKDVDFPTEDEIITIYSTNEAKKNTTKFDLPLPVHAPDSVCFAVTKLITDFEIPASLLNKCPNLETLNMTQFRARHHIRGSVKGSKSHGSTFLQSTASKNLSKNAKNNLNKFTDLLNGSNTNKKIFGKLVSSKKATTRIEGRKSTSIPDALVSSSRKNGMLTSANFEDTLVEEIENKFNSPRV